MFEKATRKKLRFESASGLLSCEQLWDLPLTGKTSLDAIAKDVNRKLKSAEEESFVETPTKSEADDVLRLSILKHVISVRLDEKHKATNRAATQELRRKLESVLIQREHEELASKTPEEILKMLKELDD